MDLINSTTAATWLGVSEQDPFLARLVTVASALVTSYLDQQTPYQAPQDVPEPVQQATLEVVAALYRNRTTNSAVSALTLGDSAVTFRDLADFNPMTPTAKLLLAPYRRIYITGSC